MGYEVDSDRIQTGLMMLILDKTRWFMSDAIMHSWIGISLANESWIHVWVWMALFVTTSLGNISVPEFWVHWWKHLVDYMDGLSWYHVFRLLIRKLHVATGIYGKKCGPFRNAVYGWTRVDSRNP